jgi:hypothetical protein
MTATVHYESPNRAHITRYFFTEERLEAFVSCLRRNAIIKLDGRKIGEVFRSDGADDRRIKWLWSFEKWEAK